MALGVALGVSGVVLSLWIYVGAAVVAATGGGSGLGQPGALAWIAGPAVLGVGLGWLVGRRWRRGAKGRP